MTKLRKRGKGKIRVGIIGTRYGTRVQYPSFHANPDIDVLAICSANPNRAQEEAQRLGIPFAFSDYRKMLELEDLDAVSVVTPTHLHHEMTLAALKANKHVLCEKPFAMNVSQAREMLETAQAQGLVHMINHEFRYTPARSRMRELIQEGFLGQLHMVSCTLFLGGSDNPTTRRPWDWLSEASKGGGFLGHSGSHFIDAIRDFFGEFSAVGGTTHVAIDRRYPPGTNESSRVDANDTFGFVFRLQNGALGTICGSDAIRFGSGFRMEAYGQEGTLALQSSMFWKNERTLMGAGAGEQQLREVEIPERLALYSDKDGVEMVAQRILVDRFVASIRGQEQATPNFRDGLRCQEIIDAVIKSGEENQWVELPIEENMPQY